MPRRSYTQAELSKPALDGVKENCPFCRQWGHMDWRSDEDDMPLTSSSTANVRTTIGDRLVSAPGQFAGVLVSCPYCRPNDFVRDVEIELAKDVLTQ